MGREPRTAELRAAQAVAAAEPCLLPGAYRAQLDAPAQSAGELLLDPARLEAPLGTVGEDKARAVEHDLGPDRLRRQVVGSDELPEEQHRPLCLAAVLARLLLVCFGRPPDDPLEPATKLRAVDLVVRLDDAAELLPAGGLADDTLVPKQLEPSGIEGVDLPSGREHDSYRVWHGLIVTR